MLKSEVEKVLEEMGVNSNEWSRVLSKLVKPYAFNLYDRTEISELTNYLNEHYGADNGFYSEIERDYSDYYGEQQFGLSYESYKSLTEEKLRAEISTFKEEKKANETRYYEIQIASLQKKLDEVRNAK